ILIAAGTESGEKALEGLGWELTDKQEKREKAVKEFLEQRRQKRASALEAARKEVAGPENLLAFLSTCIKCHNCMVNCPICYCKECFFNSPTFELEAEKYLDWARSRGGLRMPNDTLFFHLTRLSHMSSSCVACGACTEACPSDIEIAKVFTVVGSNAQKMFEYVPGRSLDEPLPLATFKEDELTEVER
ncbi:MAG: 4Fe-4S binding protein, partial [candidate division KSB1 bacterium]|nr:4Fe-4S binding protein [candidate division KSB1 bacterium]